MFSAAIALTLAEIVAETAAPTSAGWLCACAPIWNEPSSRSIRAALPWSDLTGYPPTYAISGYLARILSPVVGDTDYTVKNSCEFADFSHNVKVAQKPSKRLQLICIGDSHVLN